MRSCFLLTGLLVASLAGCGKGGDVAPKAEGPPVVYTTFYPTLYFVERLAGSHVRAVCPVPDDADAIFWMPPPAEIAAYQAADLIVVNGAGFEKWVEKVSLPSARLVDTAAGFEDEFLRYETAVTHSHGPSGAHSHEGLDGHTWVDPQNAIRQARAIRDALSSRLPEHRDSIATAFAALEKDLQQLDAALEKATGEGDPPPILCSHPAYNYVAKRYGWNIQNLDLDPEAMPPDEQLAEIRKLLEKHPAKHILWESAPAAEIAAKLTADLGLESVVFSPCELLGAEAKKAGDDYLSIMRRNIAALAPVFGR